MPCTKWLTYPPKWDPNKPSKGIIIIVVSTKTSSHCILCMAQNLIYTAKESCATDVCNRSVVCVSKDVYPYHHRHFASLRQIRTCPCPFKRHWSKVSKVYVDLYSASHSVTCKQHHICLYSQSQSITIRWPVLIAPTHEGMARLSWPEWLVRLR